MNDNLGLFGGNEPSDDEPVDLDELRAALRHTAGAPQVPNRVAARREQRERRQAEKRRRSRKRRSTIVAVVVLALMAGGIAFGYNWWRGQQDTPIPDFQGAGGSEVVVRIVSGDSVSDIAQTLYEAKVVASAEAFTAVASGDADVRALRPGFYRVRVQASAQAAADALVDTNSRVGKLRIIPGLQLADVVANTAKGSSTVEGYVTAITRAACVPINNVSKCFTTDELWHAIETTPAAELGVVEWAVERVDAAPDPRRRLEGMLMPGDYDVPPGVSALETLKSLVAASASRWNSTEIIARSQAIGKTPYEMTIIASIVEEEGTKADMPKVSRVIFNRLAKPMKLQMDSTVNYALNRAQIAVSLKDLKTPSPYNTYLNMGLPPTPIASPGEEALAASFEPMDGRWLFFVKVDLKGTSCFSITEAEHNACVEKARKNGVFDQ